MTCPTCHRPTNWQDNPHRPFCSERCKLLDFGAWANEEYKVPAQEPSPALDEAEKRPGEDEETIH
jgi:uncharacterized protein